jgi:hypothetical protein
VTLAERFNLYNVQRVILPIKIRTFTIWWGPGPPSEPPGLNNLYRLHRPLVVTLLRLQLFCFYFYVLHFCPTSFLRPSYCSLNFLLPPVHSYVFFYLSLYFFFLLFLLSFSSAFFIYIFLLPYFIFSACKSKSLPTNSWNYTSTSPCVFTKSS